MIHELIPIRLSHLLGHSGVGSIVQGPHALVVVEDTRQWTDRNGTPAGNPIPYVERVRMALGIEEQLREPPVARERANGEIDGICVPALRFPSWARCPACGALYRWPWRDKEYSPCCTHEACTHRPPLEQVPWVLAHPEGYLADVPWHALAHREKRDPKQRACKVQDRLRLREKGYEERSLQCDACKATATFRGDEHLPFMAARVQPWTREDQVAHTEDAQHDEKDLAQVLSVNDARLYSPVPASALVIPPESRVRKGTVVDQLYRNSGDRARLDQAQNRLARKSALRTLATKYRCTSADIEAALNEIARGYPLYGERLTPGQLRESEFKAFLEVLPDQREDEDLVTHNQSDEWHALGTEDALDADQRRMIAATTHLVRVDRLKEVRVLKGFTRLGGKRIIPPDIVGCSDWLPAIELYGEGIFLTLDDERLGRWEQDPAVVSRLAPLRSRFARSGRDAPNPLTARFLLLHTLSHLLMRQIESEGGYPAASLSERIYCARAPEPMAGILIYVAVPDIAGSLGGLAELAEPRRFLGILARALGHSRWCSLDPVCSEHEGQGPDLLNRAACHACALVPEPACEYGNTLLDRGFVKDDASGLPAFFGMD